MKLDTDLLSEVKELCEKFVKTAFVQPMDMAGQMGGAPMGAPPMGAPPMGAPPMGAPPMGAPEAPVEPMLPPGPPSGGDLEARVANLEQQLVALLELLQQMFGQGGASQGAPLPQ